MGFCLTWQRNAEKGAEMPPAPTVNPLKCDKCEFVGKNAQSLRLHTTKKHGA